MVNLIGVEAQKKGKRAEDRVADIASDLGLEVYYEQQLDFGGRVDFVIAGIKFQVSATGKSAQTEKRLRQRGIWCIEAGDHIQDDSIKQQIYLAINSES